jgi:hypothetical protein
MARDTVKQVEQKDVKAIVVYKKDGVTIVKTYANPESAWHFRTQRLPKKSGVTGITYREV